MIIEDYTLLEAFYQTVITISTIGFEEIEPYPENEAPLELHQYLVFMKLVL